MKMSGSFLSRFIFVLGMVFLSFPVRGSISTYCADDPVTDSAAAATAFATGVKVNRGVVSRRIPGDGAGLPTILELFRRRGAATGVVTTSALTHATPAAFASHVTSRNDYSRIASQMLYFTRPRVLFGGGGDDYSIDNDRAADAGYSVVSNASELSGYSGDGPVCGVFQMVTCHTKRQDMVRLPICRKWSPRRWMCSTSGAISFYW